MKKYVIHDDDGNIKAVIRTTKSRPPGAPEGLRVKEIAERVAPSQMLAAKMERGRLVTKAEARRKAVRA